MFLEITSRILSAPPPILLTNASTRESDMCGEQMADPRGSSKPPGVFRLKVGLMDTMRMLVSLDTVKVRKMALVWIMTGSCQLRGSILLLKAGCRSTTPEPPGCIRLLQMKGSSMLKLLLSSTVPFQENMSLRLSQTSHGNRSKDGTGKILPGTRFGHLGYRQVKRRPEFIK